MKLRWYFIALIFISFLSIAFDIVRVAGASMSPSLCDTDIVLVRRIWPREDLHGKVVTAAQGSDVILKRVVGMAGDKIRILRGDVVRNGRAISEPYVCPVDENIFVTWPDAHTPISPREVSVPDGGVFLLGDNRIESRDSRSDGPFLTSNLQAVMVVRLPASVQQNSCKCLVSANRTVIVEKVR